MGAGVMGDVDQSREGQKNASREVQHGDRSSAQNTGDIRHSGIARRLPWVQRLRPGSWFHNADFREGRRLPRRHRLALDLARASNSLWTNLKGKRGCAVWDDSFMTKLIAG